MASMIGGVGQHEGSHRRTASTLVLLMLACSLSAAMSAPLAGAHTSSVTEWSQNGYNDTGWILLEATGADSANGTMAMADLFQTFAPGSQISNLTFEMRVNGSQGVWADQPQLTMMDIQSPILDWRGEGDLGRQNSFAIGGDPHSGRLTPTSDTGAAWVLPAGATIEDLVIEALRPVDPFISFDAIDVDIRASAVHPTDGRLWVAFDDAFGTIDANNDPWVIDVEEEISILDIAIDPVAGRLLLALENGTIESRDINSGAHLGNLPAINLSGMSSFASGSVAYVLDVDSTGTVWAGVLCALTSLSSGDLVWSYESRLGGGQDDCQSGTGDQAGGTLDIKPTDILIDGSDIYVGTARHGVLLWDGSSATFWNTAGPMTSDEILGFAQAGDHLLIATHDAGVVRWDTNTDSWLATWSSSNWLADDRIHSISYQAGWVHILAGDTVHAYDTASLSFASNDRIDTIGLVLDGGDLIAWNPGGSRGPANATVLVSDGSGTLARLEPASSPNLVDNPIVASGPTSNDMHSVVRVGDIGWIGGDGYIDRYDFSIQRWLPPIVTETTGLSIVHGNGVVYLGTIDDGVMAYHTNGTVYGHWTEVDGLGADIVRSVAYDTATNLLVAGHPQSGFSIIDVINGSIETVTMRDDIDSNFITDVATRNGIAYLATENKGVMRYDLTTDTVLSSWNSLGADNLNSAPIATDGSTIYLGLEGFGVLVYDRVSGDIIDHWMAPTNGAGQVNQATRLPSNNVRSLHSDANGGVIIGTSQGMARWNGQSIQEFNAGRPTWNSPREFNSVTSTTTDVWAATNAGVCRFDYTYQLDECFNEEDGLPATYALEVDLIGTNTLYVGTYEGAAVFATNNDTVIDVWTAGDPTGQSQVVVVGDIAYLGMQNVGVARYNLTSGEWLQAWDGDQGILRDDDVTAIAPGRAANDIWVGGEFGLTRIDVVNETVEDDWDQGTNAGGPTLSNSEPAEMVIVDDALYYSLEQSGWTSNDNIYRIDLTNDTSSTIDAGQRIGTSGIVYGLNVVGDQVWIGVVPQQWWNGDGTIVRWNDTADDWDDDLDNSGSIERVNAQYIGDCFPLDPADCELWISYGDNILRRTFAANGTLIASWDNMTGPLRGIVEWQDIVYLASNDGVVRYNRTSGEWLATWTEGNGLPNNSEESITAMEVIGDDLWISSMTSSSWNTNSKILRKNGTSGAWTTTNIGSGGIPSGYGADILECAGHVHVAIGRTSGWGSQGGVARYEMDTGSWNTSWTTQGRNSLPNDDARAIACDEGHDIVYVGFNTENTGIARFSYPQDSFLPTLTTQSGISGGAVFPGGMLHDNNMLLISHLMENGDGGFSLIGTNGAQTGSGNHVDRGMDACSVERAPTATGVPAYAIGRAGGTAGYSRVDWLDLTNGFIPAGIDDHADLTSGRIVEILANETHVWVMPTQDFGSNTGSSVLEGVMLPNGSISWTRAFQFAYAQTSEMLLDGETLWVTTNAWGLVKVDLTTGNMQGVGSGFHWVHDGIAKYGNDLVIGLIGTEATAAGVQVFDPASSIYTDGRLMAALPSNIVLDFAEHDGRIWIGTFAGIGVWNLTRNDWDDPFTTLDGLLSSVVQELIVTNGELWIGSSAGLSRFDATSMNIIQTMTRADGLIGTKVSGFAYAAPATVTTPQGQVIQWPATMFVAHDGEGVTRPGASEIDIGSLSVTDIYPIDLLPSNIVICLASDAWGVHIATSSAPIIHWNASSGSMETGVSPSFLSGWPPREMSSDGTTLGIITAAGNDLLSARGSHQVIKSSSIVSLQDGFIDSGGAILVGPYGMFAFGPAPAYTELERHSMRRSEPLNVLFGGQTHDLTDYTRPGTKVVLANPDDSWTVGETGAAGPNGIRMTQQTLTMLSPVEGAATWVKTHNLNYSGTWDLAELDDTLEDRLQTAIRNAALSEDGRSVHIQMQSPQNGSMWIRMTYDWLRVEQPTEIVDLYDRPNDGGGVLVASWSPSADHGWVAYRLYLWEVDTDRPIDWEPTQSNLGSMTYDLRSASWTETMAELTTAEGLPLVDGTTYRAAIVIEYAGGQLGVPATFENATIPTDEVPIPPAWADAGPDPDGADGDLIVEWARCTELDAAFTRLWAMPFELTSAVALPQSDAISVPFDELNTTTLELEAGQPYWIALVCVDQSGQADLPNAIIVGPVVPTGGVDDGTPPAPLENVTAEDAKDDEGGRIRVSWSPSDESDCAWYTIYIEPADDMIVTNVTSFSTAAIVPDCNESSWVIDSIGGEALVDGVVYRIAVVASDAWDNADLWNVSIVEASAIADGTGGADPPERVSGLEAWDHPADDGTAIDVAWSPSGASDFGFYVVWASEHPVDSVGPKWSACEDDPVECGLLIVDQRSMVRNKPLEVILTSALYGGDGLGGASASDIRPGVPLHVTVTVHDVKGNAFLTRLADHSVIVTPVDNRGDVTPPTRLDAPDLEDRPNDVGDGLLLTFPLSTASDLDRYDVYADVVPFDSVGERLPAMSVDRMPDLPTNLTQLSDRRGLSPGVMVWVAVVPVDTNGNAYTDGLLTSNLAPIDDSQVDPGLHIPVVTGVEGGWTDGGSGIEVIWEILSDPAVRSYWIYVSESPFEDTRNATLAEAYLQGTRWVVSELNGSDIDNKTAYHIAVVAFDGEVHRYGVESVLVEAYEPENAGPPTGSEPAAWWSAGLGLNSVIGVLLLSSILGALGAIMAGRIRSRKPKPWELATPNFGLPQEDWGNDGFDADLSDVAPPVPAVAATVAPVATYDYHQQTARDISQQYSLPNVDTLVHEARHHDANADQFLDESELRSAAEALRSGNQRSDDLDMSFLDDLL